MARKAAAPVDQATAQPDESPDDVQEKAQEDFTDALLNGTIELAILDRVLERQLNIPVTSAAFSDMLYRMREYLGDDPGTFLLDLLSRADASELFQRLDGNPRYSEEERARARAAFLRLRALHAPATQAVFAVWQSTLDDWQAMDRNVYYEQATQTYQIRLTIDKYSGERFIIQGQPPSILNLALFVMVTLTQIDRAVPFETDLLNRFQQELTTFSTMFLGGDKPAESGSAADAQAVAMTSMPTMQPAVAGR